MPRRTLKQFDFENYPSPGEVYQTIMQGGYAYSFDRDAKLTRDRALVALLYLGALRVSEALRITKEQFNQPTSGKIVISQVLVSKKQMARNASNLRSVWLPLKGERAPFTSLVLAWTEKIPSGRIFDMNRRTALRATVALTGKWNHYYRALGEAYLYDHWGNDLLAVADYVNVRSSMLQEYIRGAHRRKKAV